MRRAVSLALLLPAALVAQAPNWDGDYVLDPDRSDNLKEAIAKATESLNFAMKPILRKKLEGSEKPAANLNILKGSAVTMQVEKNLPFTTSPGNPAKWKRLDGEGFEVSCEERAPGFALSFRQDDVVRTQTYNLSEDGRTLKVEVTLRNPKLPEPMRYKLIYRKAG
jgi:hypothetical protein